MERCTTRRTHAVLGALLACSALGGCGVAGYDPVNGRVTTQMGDHEVVITNCHVPRPPDVTTSDQGRTFHFSVCDHTVVIQGQTLFVDGDAQGQLTAGDRVLIDDGKTSIHPR